MRSFQINSTIVFAAALAGSLACSSSTDDTPGTGTGGQTSATGGSGGAGAVPGAGGTGGTPATGGIGGTGGGATGGSGGATGGSGGATGGAPGVGGTGGAGGTGGSGDTGGAGGTGGSGDTGGSGNTGGTGQLGTGVMEGSGRSEEQFHTAEVSRSGVPFALITNGWGPGWGSHAISWEGTSFTVESTSGSSGMFGEPASFPTVFCGRYSVRDVPDCGLPAAISSISSLRTGWRWSKNGNEGEYNASYDIWMGNGTQLQGYYMVWLRDPPSYQPAGSLNMSHRNVTVENLPGQWDIWNGMVNGLPITNWVRAEGNDSYEIEFDVMDLIRDAEARGVTVPGTHVNAVAVGFEIWEGPITNLQSVDFYVDVQTN